MRLLVFGETGQLGRALAQRPPSLSARMIRLGRRAADFCDPDALRRAVSVTAPDVVVIAAGYTAVDQAEAEPELAHAVNATAPGVIAEAAAEAGAAVIHISTDYVYDGSKEGPWVEGDPVGPRNVYGESKLAGEAAAAANPRHVILRTAWLFSPTGRNFVKTMLALAVERERLQVVDDQIGRPTSATDLAAAVVSIARRLAAGDGATGVLHFTNSGPAASWADVAEAIFRLRGGEGPEIERISTEAFGAAAARPKNSVLDLSALEAAYGITPRPWEAALEETLDRLGARAKRGAA